MGLGQQSWAWRVRVRVRAPACAPALFSCPGWCGEPVCRCARDREGDGSFQRSRTASARQARPGLKVGASDLPRELGPGLAWAASPAMIAKTLFAHRRSRSELSQPGQSEWHADVVSGTWDGIRQCRYEPCRDALCTGFVMHAVRLSRRSLVFGCQGFRVAPVTQRNEHSCLATHLPACLPAHLPTQAGSAGRNNVPAARLPHTSKHAS